MLAGVVLSSGRLMVSTFGEELGVAPDGPSYTGVDETVLVAGDVDRDNLRNVSVACD